MSENTQPYSENGVLISKSSINVGDLVTLSYKGLLAESGAEQVYAYVGYGETWEEKGFVPMSKDAGIFKATFEVILPGDLNISFKDNANNWDNNSTNNYSFKVKKKAAKAVKADAVKEVKEVPVAETTAKPKATRKKKES